MKIPKIFWVVVAGLGLLIVDAECLFNNALSFVSVSYDGRYVYTLWGFGLFIAIINLIFVAAVYKAYFMKSSKDK